MGQEGEREGKQAPVYFRDHSCLEQEMPATHPARQVHQTQIVAQPRHLLGKHPAGWSSKEVRQCPMAQDWFSAAPPPLNTLGAHFLPAARTGDAYLNGSGRVTCGLASPERRGWGWWREESKAQREQVSFKVMPQETGQSPHHLSPTLRRKSGGSGLPLSEIPVPVCSQSAEEGQTAQCPPANPPFLQGHPQREPGPES